MPEHPTWMCSATVSADGRWLWLSIGDGCEPANKAYVCDISRLPHRDLVAGGGTAWEDVAFDAEAGTPRLPFVRLADEFKASWQLVAVEGSVLTVQTNAGAPRERLVAVDMAEARDGALDAGRFREVLPEHSKDLLQARACRSCMPALSCNTPAGAARAPVQCVGGVRLLCAAAQVF